MRILLVHGSIPYSICLKGFWVLGLFFFLSPPGFGGFRVYEVRGLLVLGFRVKGLGFWGLRLGMFWAWPQGDGL